MIEGVLAGRHSSRQRGHSVEFNDYRQYMPGDELSDVDWKVYGRSDKLFIKLYEHDTELTVNLLLDSSASMAYGGHAPAKQRRGLTKYDQACFLAAAIAFLTLKQRDRVSFAFARQGLANLQRPTSALSHLRSILALMESAKPSARADLPDAIQTYGRSVGRRGLLVVLSDLLDDQGAILKALSRSTARGSEVIIFHILHDDELQLPRTQNAVFIDSETQERVRLDVQDIHAEYQQAMSAFLHRWAQSCKSLGIDYNLVSTSDHYHEILQKYLLRRSIRRRG